MSEKAAESNGNAALSWARKVVIGVIGGTILIVGFFLIFLPGPAFVVIPVGLAVLGTEFVWARRLLSILRQHAGRIFERRDTNRTSRSGQPFDSESQPTI